MLKVVFISLACLALLQTVCLADLFNYGMDYERENGSDSWGQPDWDEVECNNIEECTGYPNKYPHGFGFSIERDSQCRWCPEGGSENCGIHLQSPIDLKRDRSIPESEFEKDCPDWHFMQTRDDSCDFDDLRDSFSIQRHALQMDIPQLDNGDIACQNVNGTRLYPRLDYSKGFPDWWWMQRLDISVPSQHTQEGHQYAAEVTLAHFYEVDHPKNQLGHIAVFLQDYDDADSWAFLDRLICLWRIEEDKVREACGRDPVRPYGRCRLFRGQRPTEEWLNEEANGFGEDSLTPEPTVAPTIVPTKKPTAAPITEAPVTGTVEPTIEQTQGNLTVEPSIAPVFVKPILSEEPSDRPSDSPSTQPSPLISNYTIPPDIDCDDQDFSMSRFCSSSDPCCESERSDSDFCWAAYDILGSRVESACYHCCDEPKRVGPARAEIPELPKTIQCSDIRFVHRTCKEDSCCSNPRSGSNFCEAQYSRYAQEIEEVCYYCCQTPKEVGPPTFGRNLGSILNSTGNEIPEGAKVTYSHGKKFLLGPENFEEDEFDENEYIEKIKASRRSLQTGPHLEDYEDVEWNPYEWLIKVGTEYYFRYEGTMLVPPCWETVHWRVMKDPIRVHRRQIAELNRLLAWRRDPDTCRRDTAGVVSDDGNTVKMNREVQYYHNRHRKVFCECKDWPSKFDGDRAWCDDWRDDVDHDRFYRRPYSFDSNGKWLPDDVDR